MPQPNYPFNIPAFIEGVNKRVKPPTPVTNLFFGTPKTVNSNVIQMDIADGPDGISIEISYDAKSLKVNRADWDSITVKIPRFSEHETVKPSDNLGRRVFNSATLMQLGIDTQRQEALADLIQRSDMTKEFMSVGALTGTVRDGAGKEIVVYPVNAVGALNFSTTDSVYETFDEAFLAFEDILGDPGDLYAWFGRDAWNFYRNSPEMEELRKKYPLEFAAGNIPNQTGKVSARRLSHTYVDAADSTRKPFLADNRMIITSSRLNGTMLYAPTETPQGLIQQQTFIDEWTERDPPVTYIRHESNFLPFMKRPDAIRTYTVTG